MINVSLLDEQKKVCNTKSKLHYPKKMFGYIADIISRDSTLLSSIIGCVFGQHVSYSI